MNSTQFTFGDKFDRAREVLKRASNEYGDDVGPVVLAISGGTDSVVAADVVATLGPEYGIEPTHVFHANTGASVPQTPLVAKVFAAMHDLEFVESGPRNDKDRLAPRILENGWPAGYSGSFVSGGHAIEWANRKDKPMDVLYSELEGLQIWISGARVNESDQRSRNIVDGAVDRQDRRPYRVWVSPIHGWSDDEKIEYLLERGLPVSESYYVLGFSGECTACSFDDAGLLTDLDILAPELAAAIRTLAVWVGMRAVRGDVELSPYQLCWGWEPEDVEALEVDEGQTVLSDLDRERDVDRETLEYDESALDDMKALGCSAESCADRDIPDWLSEVEDDQIIDRADVLDYWENGVDVVAERFTA